MKDIMMKSALFALIIASNTGFSRPIESIGQCSAEIATSKGREVAEVIAKVNGIDKTITISDTRLMIDEDYYFVETAYDLGLSVPAFTVKIARSSCFVTDITFSNHEG